MVSDHKQFLYKDGETRIFEMGEAIPEGWVDSPNSDNVTMAHEEPAPEAPLETGEVLDEAEVPEPDKYPSQMNKTELVDFGKQLGLDLDMEMSKTAMRRKINEAMKDPE